MRSARPGERSGSGKPAGVGGKRCAIYTRKSSEEGLEQDFNSLHAQREACEAYIASQRHEGWSLVPSHYDDGGYSGGSMERPGLAALMADVEAGRIDIVVVYKVDRLTRSLADFAKIVERFDAKGISFVSVTQAFNTTSSMGRLTLNVLLSFAQFEREVTAERIRDKIAASKRKGMWMGGHVPLGYRVENRKLVIDEVEVEQVRTIFDLYLKLGSIPALKDELDRREMRTRVRTRSDGSTFGGVLFFTGALSALLRNRAYIGEIIHKGEHHAGEHEPIVDAAVFEKVQQRLASQLVERTKRLSPNGLLRGLIFDSRGNRMSPSYTVKHGARYHYYISRALLENRKAEAGSPPRASATAIDELVLGALRQRPGALPPDEPAQRELVLELIERVEVNRSQLVITFASHTSQADRVVALPWLQRQVKPEKVIHEAASVASEAAGAAPHQRRANRERLVKAIIKARSWRDDLIAGRTDSVEAIAESEGKSSRNIRMMIQLAFLDPWIVEAAADGRLPDSIGATEIARDLPMAWQEQRRLLGL
jgi:DNA invertase Pin-like site-specific DNA recombinase